MVIPLANTASCRQLVAAEVLSQRVVFQGGRQLRRMDNHKHRAFNSRHNFRYFSILALADLNVH